MLMRTAVSSQEPNYTDFFPLSQANGPGLKRLDEPCSLKESLPNSENNTSQLVSGVTGTRHTGMSGKELGMWGYTPKVN